jgi:hypothetical protein
MPQDCKPAGDPICLSRKIAAAKFYGRLCKINQRLPSVSGARNAG